MTSHHSGLSYGFGHKTLAHSFSAHRITVAIERLVLVIAAGLGLLMLVQFLYPTSYVRPGVRVAGVGLGWQNQAKAAQRLQTLEQQSLTIQGATKRYNPRFQEVGLLVDGQATARQARRYTWPERLTPFSLFKRDVDVTVTKRYDNQRLADWAKRIAADNQRPAVDATVTKQANQYLIKPAEPGATYDQASVEAELKQTMVSTNTTINLAGTAIAPAISTDMLEAVVQTWQKQTSQPLELTVSGASLTLSTDQLRQFTNIVTDTANKRAEIQYDRGAFKTALASAANQVTSAPADKAVSLDDGVNQMIAALGNQQKADIQLKPVTITTPVNRSYSPTSGGALALIQDWQKDTRLNTGVFFKELGPPHRSASYRGHESFVPASTYKSFVGYYVYHRIDEGTLTFESTAGLDRSVRACMIEMLHWSTNICSVAFGRYFGWSTLNTFLKQTGINHTHLESNAMQTTPADLAELLERLNSGKLLQPGTTAAFLDILKRHPYRAGIPAGVPGVVVADKVGWLDDVWNDAAIVYHPRGTYILVIMTRYGSPSQMADLSRRINQFVSQ